MSLRCSNVNPGCEISPAKRPASLAFAAGSSSIPGPLLWLHSCHGLDASQLQSLPVNRAWLQGGGGLDFSRGGGGAFFLGCKGGGVEFSGGPIFGLFVLFSFQGATKSKPIAWS